ncbi:hypothetical protein RvVAT039_20720 [Agrobacterium vitis]|nr:hypothetical protein RvVAT039_20720 [Agrobacterium vitis]
MGLKTGLWDQAVIDGAEVEMVDDADEVPAAMGEDIALLPLAAKPLSVLAGLALGWFFELSPTSGNAVSVVSAIRS